MANIDDIVIPDLPLDGAESLAGVWDQEYSVHKKIVLQETLSGLEDYCDDPPAKPWKLSSWIDHEHDPITNFRWNLSFTYSSGLTPNASRYYSIGMVNPDGAAVAGITETYGTFPTSLTLKMQPVNGVWTFNLIERTVSLQQITKATVTKFITVRTGTTSLTTVVAF